jgi:hypothetical protein
VHDGQHLPPLADESEPLGPWRDESGRRSVHRAAVESLVFAECVAGNGASGSAFASRTGFVTGLAAATAGLSTDFFSGGLAAVEAVLSTASFGVNLAAARPGLSADLLWAGFAAVTGLSMDFIPVAKGIWATGLAGTSRVSVFKLA